MRYDLENRDKRKLYYYLYECIRTDILTGRLSAKAKLPSRRQLAKENGISVTTVMNAYEQLLMEGYIESVPKSGYYVAKILPMQVKPKERPNYPKLYEEEVWFADFRANDTLYHNFPFSTWKKVVRETLSEYDDEIIHRGNMFGAEILRKEIAEYLYQNRGMNVSPECIVIGVSIEYLYERIMKLLPEYTRYAVENPGYQKIPRILQEHGVSWKLIDMDQQGVSMQSLQESDAQVVHVSPEHHYPLGIVMSTRRRQELLEWAAQAPGRFIIEDDYDCEFRYHYMSISALKGMDVNGKVIYMNTFSKTMSPSIRISYMVLPESLIQRFISTTNFYTNTTSTLEQYAMSKFLRDGYFERHINRMKKYYQKEDETLRQILLAHPAIPIKKISPFSSGTHLLVYLDTQISDVALKNHAARQGINLAFLTDFCLKEHERYEHIMILNYSDLSPEKLDTAVERIGNCFRREIV